MNEKYHYLLKATPSRLKKVAVWPNTHKQIQRVKQNEETEKYVPSERIKQTSEKKKGGNPLVVSQLMDQCHID